MGVRVAYGYRADIDGAVKSGIIPKDCIIITEDGDEAEMMFYDIDGRMKPIAERNRFYSFAEAASWVEKHDCSGHVFSILSGETWVPYVVQADGSLNPIQGETADIEIVRVLDGGSAAGY